MDLLTILLQAAASQGSPYSSLILFVGILVVFYFFLIRPQQKRQKEERLFRESLSKGDKILTIGGIYGNVISLDDNTALIEIDQNVKIRVDKTALRSATDNTQK